METGPQSGPMGHRNGPGPDPATRRNVDAASRLQDQPKPMSGITVVDPDRRYASVRSLACLSI